MKIRSLTAVAAPALLGIFASGATFANIKAKIGRSADQALRRFYFLNPANRALVGKATGVLIHRHVTKAAPRVGTVKGSCRSKVIPSITTASQPPRLDSRLAWQVI